MKTFTKVMLSLAGIFATVGVVCIVIAFVMGFSTNEFVKMFQDGDFSIQIEDGELQIFGVNDSLILEIEDVFEENENSDFNEEGDVEGIASGTEVVAGETTTYKVEETCNSMDIEFGAGVLEVRYDNVDSVQIEQRNIPDVKISVNDGALVIREGSDIEVGINEVEDRSLTILVPYETSFDEVKMEIGAAQASVSQLKTEAFDLEVGAGQAIVKELMVQDLIVEAGVGEVDIEIVGAEADYNYEIECGIGQVIVGKYSWEGLGAEQSVANDGAECHMSIECGVGLVNMHFTCDAEKGTCCDPSHNHNWQNNHNNQHHKEHL